MPKKEKEKEKKVAAKKKVVRKPKAVEAKREEIAPAPPEVKPPEVEVKKVPRKKEEKVALPKYYGTGRRKTSIARVYLIPGAGKISVNQRPFENYICGRKILEIRALEPLRLTQTKDRYDVFADVAGGGIASQMDAVRQGISRALVSAHPEFRKNLRTIGLLTRDPRMKERKKYGQKRARKRFQYSKR